MDLSLIKKSFIRLINNRASYVLLGMTLLSIIVFFLLIERVNPLEIPIPKSKGKVSFFTDVTDGGNSRLINTKFTDSSIIINYRLNQGFITPYAGFTINEIGGERTDFSKFNKIHLKLRSKGINNINIHISTKDKDVKDKNHRLADRISAVNLNLENGLFDRDVMYGQFETPTWWASAIHQSINDFGPIDWSQLRTLSVVTGINYDPKVDQELELIKVCFYRDYSQFVIFSISIFLLTVLAIYIYHFYRTIKSERKNITIEYKPIEYRVKTGGEMDAVLDYIYENYMDPELTLSKVAKSVAISERNISKFITEKHQCNFRTYINNIRIAEAERLLKSTNYNISEIGYRVGFNDPSSFSKIFKKITGKSPSEFND